MVGRAPTAVAQEELEMVYKTGIKPTDYLANK